ncbi:MAG: GTP-binding protein [Thermoplasmata archaeon]
MITTKKVYLKKIGLVGDSGVGKKTIARKVAFSPFDDAVIDTLGTKVSKYTFSFDFPEMSMRLAILMWDITGKNEFVRVRPRYCIGAEGVAVVGDLSRPETIEHMPAWVEEVFRVLKEKVPVVFIGNKLDLIDGKEIPKCREKLRVLSQPYGGHSFLMSTTKDIGISDPFQVLARLICQRQDEANKKQKAMELIESKRSNLTTIKKELRNFWKGREKDETKEEGMKETEESKPVVEDKSEETKTNEDKDTKPTLKDKTKESELPEEAKASKLPIDDKIENKEKKVKELENVSEIQKN